MTRKIDEQVARKLRGWKSNCKCEYPIESAHHNCPGEFGNCHHANNCSLPPYSTSIESAWEMVEKIPHFTLYHADIYSAKWKVSWLGLEGVEYAGSDTAPMTICKAFLALK